MTAQEAARKLAQQLDYPSWLTSIGVGGREDGTPFIAVFLKRDLYHFEEKHLPPTWEGYEIERKVVGEMRLC